MDDRVPEHICLAIGHSSQASHIEADPSLCPEFSDSGRADIVRALRVLAQIDGKEAALVPLKPTQAMLRPFYECPPDELELAWAAMLKIVETTQPLQTRVCENERSDDSSARGEL